VSLDRFKIGRGISVRLAGLARLRDADAESFNDTQRFHCVCNRGIAVIRQVRLAEITRRHDSEGAAGTLDLDTVIRTGALVPS
jgi:hypothetical protein